MTNSAVGISPDELQTYQEQVRSEDVNVSEYDIWEKDIVHGKMGGNKGVANFAAYIAIWEDQKGKMRVDEELVEELDRRQGEAEGMRNPDNKSKYENIVGRLDDKSVDGHEFLNVLIDDFLREKNGNENYARKSANSNQKYGGEIMKDIEENLDDLVGYMETMVDAAENELPDDSDLASALSEADAMVDQSRQALRNHKDLKSSYDEARENLEEAYDTLQDAYDAVDQASDVGARHKKAFEHMISDAGQQIEEYMNQTEAYIDETRQNLDEITSGSVSSMPSPSPEVQQELDK